MVVQVDTTARCPRAIYVHSSTTLERRFRSRLPHLKDDQLTLLSLLDYLVGTLFSLKRTVIRTFFPGNFNDPTAITQRTRMQGAEVCM